MHIYNTVVQLRLFISTFSHRLFNNGAHIHELTALLVLRNHFYHPEGSDPLASQTNKIRDTCATHHPGIWLILLSRYTPLLWSIKAFELHVLYCETWSCRSEVRRCAASRHVLYCAAYVLCGIEAYVLLHLPHNASPSLELPACGWFTWRKMRGWTKREREREREGGC